MLGRRARGLLLLLVGVTTALKLQPVQQSTLKVDLITEAKNSAVILSSAVALIQDDAKTVDKDAVRELLSTAEFHKLKAFVYRWYSMENKLKGLLEGASMRQVRLSVR